jgi:hypothetical protein
LRFFQARDVEAAHAQLALSLDKKDKGLVWAEDLPPGRKKWRDSGGRNGTRGARELERGLLFGCSE